MIQGLCRRKHWIFIEQQNIKFDVVSMDTCRGILDGDTHMGIQGKCRGCGGPNGGGEEKKTKENGK